MSSISLEASGTDSIQIYTDWANRHLAKSQQKSSPRPQIRDISNDFRDYRVVSQLINVIVPANDFTPNFQQKIAKTTSNLDGLATCLEYLKTIGLDCAKLTKTDIDSGNLGAVLQLLYILSTHKQKLRQIKKDLKLSAMPPAVTKLPSPKSRIAQPPTTTSKENLNSNFLAPQMSTSRLQTPSRISRPATTSSSKLTPTSTASSSTQSLTKSGIRPPSSSATSSTSSRASGNNNSTSSRIATSQLQKPQHTSSRIRVATNSPASRVAAATPSEKIATVKSLAARKPEKIEPSSANSASMLKLKLFNTAPKDSAPIIAKPKEKPNTPIRNSGLKPPTSKLAKPTPTSKITYRKEHKPEPEKRCSKSSEEDESGYVGFSTQSSGSSPASTSSTEGSLSMHSASSKSSTSSSHSPSSDDLTLNASIITTVTQTAKPQIALAPEPKPVLAVIGIPNPEKEKPAIGVVSPMMTHRKLVKNESSPDISEKSEPVPKMAPIRQPPTYEQLLEQGKIQSPTKSTCASPIFGEPSTSKSEIPTSPSRILSPTPKKGEQRESVLSLERREKKKSSESSGYNSSEGGIAMFAKMREKMKEYDDMTKKAQQGYPESFEDSSSLSSGISDNIEYDDVSTDDLSGVEMATVASKHSDYGHFIRGSASQPKPLRAPSESRSRTIAEQENIHKLLSQCRTSQRGSSFGQHSIRSPGYATYSPARGSGSGTAGSGSKSGYHSLDRKSHLAEFSASGDNRIAALLSPRRIPNPQPARPRNSSSSGIYGTYHSDAFQLYRLADDQIQYSSNGSRSEMGSQLSLASTTAYASLNDKYEHAIQNMTRDLESYKSTIDSLTKKQENYTSLFELFEQKLRKLTSHIEKSNLKSEEAARFRQDIAHLREISTHLAKATQVKQHNDGAGELLRQPSLESIRSSMSSSSKSSKHDKMSLNSFGKSKKSWIRSSLSKLTKKKHSKDEMPSISGSQQMLDNVDVIELRQELQDRDSTLTEVRLVALDRARQVDMLLETVNKLKHENKQLKKERDRSNYGTRASSRASEEPLYDVAAAATSSSSASARSSMGPAAIKVTVNVDLAGRICQAVCPDNEIILGYLQIGAQISTWQDVDTMVMDLFAAYVKRIDPERTLDILGEAILGYQIGQMSRHISQTATSNLPTPSATLHPTTTIRLFLKGAAQNRVDSLVLDTLLPTQMLTQLVKYIETERRLVLAGAAGIGKSKLARSLAAYVALKLENSEEILDLKIPEDTADLLKIEKTLENLLRSSKPTIVIIDNIPKNRIAFVASVFAANSCSAPGPIVICTVNRYQIPEMQISQNQNFKMFLLTMRMEGVAGFMLRFLRRRCVEAEYRQSRQMSMEMLEVIAFLPKALQAVNQFIEKTNSIDVTIGPRVFLQCPLSVDESKNWFIKLWNDNFVPYMERVAREGKKTFGRCASFEDPTDLICEKWPWLEDPAPEDTLRRLSLQDLKSSAPANNFNPLESLIQLHATKHPPL
ncbi:unnamed protein product [Caenorhabditis angaria]|uniref:Calponin-homology (CH) domain-containing protein n=1 Tax=Caenorhabditis angaria TaxID=860376 RepID=A0A9P1N0Y9_9PELO|nr:unnamed protein product [Caenorhabditis angaria]